MGFENSTEKNLRRSVGAQGSQGAGAKRIYLLASALLTLFILWFLFTHITVGEVVSFISAIDTTILPWFFFCSFASSIFRTWTYSLLLLSSGFRPNKFYLFLVVIIRNTLSDALPARLGTLSYVALVTTRLGVSLGAATSSFAITFLFEIVAIVPLLLIAAIAVALQAKIALIPLLIGSALLLIVSASLVIFLPNLMTLFSYCSERLNFIRLKETFLEAKQDIIIAKSQGIYLKIFILSIFTRIFKYGGLYFLLVAMLSPHGFSFVEVAPQKAFLGMAAAELSASLPISGIAGFGAYQGTWASVFTLLGFPEKLSLLSSVSHHLFTQAYGYSLGGVAGLLLLITGWCRSLRGSDKVES